MASAPSQSILLHLRQFAGHFEQCTTDHDLLKQFCANCDERAFSELVRRHGPMLLRVSYRVLRNRHDAEDICQATFLVLAGKAGSIRWHESVAGWLFRTAYHLSLRSRTSAMRRRRREARAKPLRATVEPAAELTVREFQAALDEELCRLPAGIREPILLCCLEGKSRESAARFLGCTVPNVKNRLEKGRELLRARLRRRGVSLETTLASICLAEQGARATGGMAASASIAKAALAIATGRATLTCVLPNSVAKLAEGALKSMLPIKFASASLMILGCAVAGVIGFASTKTPSEEPPRLRHIESPATQRTESKKEETGDQRAARLALRVHEEAAAFDKLPQFSYKVRYRSGTVDSMRVVDDGTLDRFQQALTAPILDNDWGVGWYRTSFEWDEKHFFQVRLWPKTELGDDTRAWTRDEAWERSERAGKHPCHFVRSAEPRTFWKNLLLFESSYLRLTPHRFWWGRMVHPRHQNMSLVPPDKAAWKHVGEEMVANHTCDVVESGECAQRLWVNQASGRVQRAASYHFVDHERMAQWWPAFRRSEAMKRIAGKTFAKSSEYVKFWRDDATEDQLVQLAIETSRANSAHWPAGYSLHELVDFDDYREVAPRVWLPFREVRTFWHYADAKGKHTFLRSELIVEQVRTDVDLVDRYTGLMPKEGDRVQDQRFGVPVDYDYSPKRTDDEIRRLADVQRQEIAKAQEQTREFVKPMEAMVGKPAPPLPHKGWVGGNRPDTRGKPYLVHFWMAGCAPCKGDMPLLKGAAENGRMVIGMHPAGTPTEEIEKLIREQKLSYPTFVGEDKADGSKNAKIGGYPAIMFPYAVLVDAQGRVAAHGSLFDLADKLGDVFGSAP